MSMPQETGSFQSTTPEESFEMSNTLVRTHFPHSNISSTSSCDPLETRDRFCPFIPSAEQWGSLKEAIRRIYIHNNRNKNDMRSIMRLVYHFEPTSVTLSTWSTRWLTFKLEKTERLQLQITSLETFQEFERFPR